MDRLALGLGRSPWGESGFGRARGLMHAFRLAERILEHQHPPQSLRDGGIVRYEVLKLPGRALPLRGQPPVLRGDAVVGVHFDNRVLASLDAAEPNLHVLTWRLTRLGAEDLSVLAELARAGALPAETRAIWGETLLYRALRRLGFETRPTPRTFRTPFARLFFLGILKIYGRPGKLVDSRLLAHLQLGEAWMSLDELQRRYPPRPNISVGKREVPTS